MKKNTVKLNEAQLRNIVAESVKKVLNEMKLSADPKRANTPKLKADIQIAKQNLERVTQNMLSAVNVDGLKVKAIPRGKVIFYINNNSIDDASQLSQEIQNAGFDIEQEMNNGELHCYVVNTESNDLAKAASYYAKVIGTMSARLREIEMNKMSSAEREEYL